MEELFIPIEFYRIKELNNTERTVLAIYRHYTFKSDLHYCTLKNEDVCNLIGLKDVRYLRRIKKHLKDLGLIKTDGMNVTYINANDDGNDVWFCDV